VTLYPFPLPDIWKDANFIAFLVAKLKETKIREAELKRK